MKTLRQSSAIAGNNLKENYEQHLRNEFLIFPRRRVPFARQTTTPSGDSEEGIYALDAVKNVWFICGR